MREQLEYLMQQQKDAVIELKLKSKVSLGYDAARIEGKINAIEANILCIGVILKSNEK